MQQKLEYRTCTICRQDYTIKDIKTVLWAGKYGNEYKAWCHCNKCIKIKRG